MLVMDDFCTNKILKFLSLSCFCFSWLMIWVTKLWIKFGLGFGSSRFAADRKGTFFLGCQVYPEIEWGKNIRVVLDVGCGVASFGGYLFDKDVITMSVAPKDEHEAQVQLALERGIPALSSVMSTRLLFPSNVFDMVHCAHCQVHWHGDGMVSLIFLSSILLHSHQYNNSPSVSKGHPTVDGEAWRDIIMASP
jgi:hypothetical protein